MCKQDLEEAVVKIKNLCGRYRGTVPIKALKTLCEEILDDSTYSEYTAATQSETYKDFAYTIHVAEYGTSKNMTVEYTGYVEDGKTGEEVFATKDYATERAAETACKRWIDKQ